jgi:hypothetical protein
MGVAGQTFEGELTPNGFGVQLYKDGKPFSFPITTGEAGWDITGSDHTLTDFNESGQWFPKAGASRKTAYILDEDAPPGCEAVQDLYSWSLNFDPGKGPFTVFLDLIGYSQEQFGENLAGGEYNLGYLEHEKLGDALKEYANNPSAVEDYVNELLAAESEE